MMIKDYFLLCLLIISLGSAFGQDGTVLTYDNFISMIREHHPVSQRANLLTSEGSAYLLKAKGGFDPKIQGSLERKTFDGKEYYNLINSGFTIPLWFGPDLKIAYEQNDGVFLNPSDQVPTGGLVAVGISLPIGRGLFMDERRMAIQQAEVLQRSNELRRKLMINELLVNSSQYYLEWQENYAALEVARDGIDIARQRSEAIKLSFINGDKPAVDTLEAFITVQSRIERYNAQLIELAKSRAMINPLLWIEGQIPLELEENVIPEPINQEFKKQVMDSLSLRIEDIVLRHPEINLYENKIQSLEIENRLNRENLKPDLRLNFNPLLTPFGERVDGVFNSSDYKLGLAFKMPLFLRKERANIKLTGIKIQDSQLQQLQKNQDLKAKLNVIVSNNNILLQQQLLTRQMISNYESLLAAEIRKFGIGESSVFLVNARENKLLDLRQKLISQDIKVLLNRLELLRVSRSVF
jgi:outer membrane protein TolC